MAMTIKQASDKISQKLEAGLISRDEAIWYQGMIRRTERYGSKMSWSQQAAMRDNLLKDF
jgi:hypothetical protein